MSLTQVYGADTSASLALAIIIALPAATPKEFKTLTALILPYDAMYNMLSHPTIMKRMEESVYF